MLANCYSPIAMHVLKHVNISVFTNFFRSRGRPCAWYVDFYFIRRSWFEVLTYGGWRDDIPRSVVKGAGVVTASWYNLRVEHMLWPTSQFNRSQQAIGHCLYPSASPADRLSYSTWTPYSKTAHKSSQNTARITPSCRKCNQELLPLTAANQDNVVSGNRNITSSFAERVRCGSQWPRGLRNELSSPTQTQG
jgi:hypothetical protein